MRKDGISPGVIMAHNGFTHPICNYFINFFLYLSLNLRVDGEFMGGEGHGCAGRVVPSQQKYGRVGIKFLKEEIYGIL
jgi:hypothetical protein